MNRSGVQSSKLDEHLDIHQRTWQSEEETEPQPTSHHLNSQPKVTKKTEKLPTKKKKRLQSPLCCLDCGLTFRKQGEFETHLVTHIRLPQVYVERISPSLVLALTRQAKPKQPLKLTLKKSVDAKEDDDSYQVVSDSKQQTVLLGPGGYYALNGVTLDSVKTEGEYPTRSVEGSEVGKTGGGEEEGRVITPEDNRPPVNAEPTSDDNEEEEEEEPEPSSEDSESSKESIEDACRETIERLKSLGATVQRIPVPQHHQSPTKDPSPPPATFSPTPSELLGPEFLAPERPSCPPTPAMLEIHNPASRDSSVFPETSMTTQESLPVNGDREESGMSSDITTGQNEDSHQSNFSWNDVGSASVDEGIGSDARSASPNDETDPLLLPDSTRVEAESVVTPAKLIAEESSTGESLLQGFLSNKSEPISQPDSAISPLPTVESLGLGSEYISIEHLGETAFRCGVCGEGYTERAGLDNHCTREGHFKCERTECGSVVCNTGEELVSHQQAAHPLEGSAEAPYVQQLAQQVQRIPVPTGLSSEQSRAPTSVYHAASPTTITAQTTMYPITSYTNSPYPPQQAPGYQQQIHPRPFSNLVQQQPVKSPSPGSQRPGPQSQKRAAPSGGATSPTGKQRRMDFLVEDRNDDADCHVVAMQKRAENMPIISNVEGVRTPDSMIHLTESITLSVRQPNSPLGNSVSVVASNGRGKNDAKAVANILATRGITVTPAGAGRGGQSSPQRPALQQRVIPQSQPPPQPAPMAALNLNSAISIIPAAGSQSSRQPQIQNNRSGGTGGGNFAVPMGRSPTSRQQQREVERPPRPPTVDLTQDTPHRPPPAPQTRPVQQPYIARGRGRGRPSLNMGAATRHTCQLCNKAFSTAESLGQHMLLHRSPGKLPYSPGTQPAMAQRVRPQAQAWSTKWKCSNCPAQYPNQQGLMLHQQACRRNLQTMQQQPAQHQQQHQQPSGLPAGVELAVPVVDLKSPGTVNRLRALGINHYIPFSPFLNKPNGYIGLPIVAVDGNRLPISGNITQMGATAVVSFGPLRTLPR